MNGGGGRPGQLSDWQCYVLTAELHYEGTTGPSSCALVSLYDDGHWNATALA